jgi:hypothetical protein
VNGINGNDLRKIIIDYLKTNPTLMDGVSFESMMTWEMEDENETADAYLDRMSRTDQWGGGIEIRAFCRIYKCQVDVHIPMIGKLVHFYPYDFDENDCKSVSNLPRCNIIWTGNHFEPLVFPSSG